MNAELFLQKYRILEGLLEKRYDGQKMSSSSVVMEYIRDPDSAPVRVDLDLIREIRNILTHNADAEGDAVVQPSDAMVRRLEDIIGHVKRERLARDCGTPADNILCAHPNDNIHHVMRNMLKNGYSHVPVKDKSGLVGVFSVKSLFDYLASKGMESLRANARIAELGEYISIENRRGERYLFVSEDTTLVTVRSAFEDRSEKNNRLSLVFVTPNGSSDEKIICMLSPWDVMSSQK